MAERFTNSEAVMQRAYALAARGIGFVEPNPPVGAVIVDADLNLVGEGYHRKFGGPHAEVEALNAAQQDPRGCMLFVTLEPCCHQGKTPPCTEAIIDAGLKKVVIAIRDPALHTADGGIAALRLAGIEVEVQPAAEAERLIGPFAKLTATGVPYVHAKWAMTLDGKLAAKTGASQWISNSLSRETVHRLRGRMDAILVGSQTAITDDPLLTARPAGARTAARIVLDSQARLPLDSQLVRTADQAPVVVTATKAAAAERIEALENKGVEVLQLQTADGGDSSCVDLSALLQELGRRQMTNILVEGGAAVLGSFLDQQLIDELHVFVAAKLVGGINALTPVGGVGLAEIPIQPQLIDRTIELLDGDVYIHGRLRHGTHKQ